MNHLPTPDNSAEKRLYTTCPPEGLQESASFKVLWTVEKWNNSEDHLAGKLPDEVVYAPKNLLVTGGINLMLNLLCATTANTGLSGFTTYGSGTAVLRVGDGSTAAASGDTNLSAGANLAESVMDAGFPTVVITTATWRSTYGSSSANFTWNEVAVQNLPTGGGVNSYIRILNHKVQNFGTKASGSTWTLTLTITVS
jgi:hypothetical protein